MGQGGLQLPLSFTVLSSLHLLFSFSLSHLIFHSLLLFFPTSSLHHLLPPQSLACWHVHATGRSWLTDGWTVRAKAIRHWAA